MKNNSALKPTRRYLKTCRYLQQYLQKNIPSFEWLDPSIRIGLLRTVNDIDVCNGTIDVLWEIVCYICEKMVDHDVDDNTFHTFVTNTIMIREWGDC